MISLLCSIDVACVSTRYYPPQPAEPFPLHSRHYWYLCISFFLNLPEAEMLWVGRSEIEEVLVSAALCCFV